MTLELDPDRRLALAYVPARIRPAMEALWRLDVTFGSVLVSGREPLISRIRLAWWRESLEKLDHLPAPAEPVLRAVAEHLIPAGISGAALSRMEEGWAALVSPEALAPDQLQIYAHARGGNLFRLSARLLGDEDLSSLANAGERWALVDLARHSGESDAAVAREKAGGLISRSSWPPHLRSLGMLAALAGRDLDRGAEPMERQGSPGRMLRMVRHRLTGR